MTDAITIFDYVRDCFPVEYDIVGYSTTNRIIEAKLQGREIELVTSEEGSNLEVGEIIILMGVIVTIVKEVLEIMDYLKKRYPGRKFTERDVENASKLLEERLGENEVKKIEKSSLDSLIKTVISKKN